MGDQESLSSTGKKLVVDAAEQECLAQSKSVLQGVQMDNGEVLPSSKMSYTHFEACEEDRKESDEEVENNSKGAQRCISAIPTRLRFYRTSASQSRWVVQ
jgi:hypothetical protein